MSTALLILAYNEEIKIEQVINDFKSIFTKLIVIDDASTDRTHEILQKLSVKTNNLEIIKNNKNQGAGKSFEVGIHAFLKSDYKNLIKIDGDNQFKFEDVLKIKNILDQNEFAFIKCDRFWSSGIEGNIPNIRYLGNSFASLLIKLSTGIWNLNDPLNGLYGMNRDSLKNFQLPKLFNRYGYPFFVSNYFANLGYSNGSKIAQIRNTIKYGDEKSDLKAFTMLFKLTYFVIRNFYTGIKFKLRYSNLQTPALLDIFANLFLFLSSFSIIRFLQIRYFGSLGPQGNWFILFIIFLILFFMLLVSSRSRLNKLSETFFEQLSL